MLFLPRFVIASVPGEFLNFLRVGLGDGVVRLSFALHDVGSLVAADFQKCS